MSLSMKTPNRKMEIQALKEYFEGQLRKMEDKIKQQQGDHRPSTKFEDLCPFPEARIPDGLKIPTIPTYEGKSCPKAHLKAFCGILYTLAGNDGALIRLFQHSLKCDALDRMVYVSRQSASQNMGTVSPKFY